MNNSNNVNTILVLSSWSTGSTAIAGFLEESGGYIPKPHVETSDLLTPDAREPKAYRDALASCIDESTLKPTKSSDFFFRFFSEWHPMELKKCSDLGRQAVILKHPLQIFFLNQILQICDPKFVVVTRPLRFIEKTRLRRNWPPIYGEIGAKSIYQHIYNELHNRGKSYLAVPYESFLKNHDIQQSMLSYCSIHSSNEQFQRARHFIERRDSSN